MVHILVDGLDQFAHAFEHAAADAISGDQAEEPLDLVEPGGGGRSKMHVKPLMSLEPGQDLWVFVDFLPIVKKKSGRGGNPATETVAYPQVATDVGRLSVPTWSSLAPCSRRSRPLRAASR